ncbi:MAG: hypothetical protein GX591_00440, partial [Planctomycetes bacterium]|nr:hypothetical protein [Planctomycetota bacterium]
SAQIAVTLEVAATSTRTLVNVGDIWRYRKGDTAPAAEWNQASFDDSAWAEGPSGIGYSSDVTHPTTLGDMAGNYTSFFARRAFNVDDPAAVMNLALDIAYDDAFVAYINGVEVARSASMGGAAGTPVAFDDVSAEMYDELDPAESFTIAVPDGLLKAGTNVLAIQVHNVALSSSDALMAPRLQAMVIGEDGGGLLPGDLTGDGRVDLSDVDLLTAALRGEKTVDGADLNADGALDGADLALMVREVLGTEMGDANLDGRVDLDDFTALKDNMGITDASWAQGDFNADGVSDLDDFTVLKNFFGFQTPAPASASSVEDLQIVDLLAAEVDPLDPLAGGTVL